MSSRVMAVAVPQRRPRAVSRGLAAGPPGVPDRWHATVVPPGDNSPQFCGGATPRARFREPRSSSSSQTADPTTCKATPQIRMYQVVHMPGLPVGNRSTPRFVPQCPPTSYPSNSSLSFRRLAATASRTRGTATRASRRPGPRSSTSTVLVNRVPSPVASRA
jgi:hypothetical protein